jgi:hypothetical protein
VSPGHPGKEEEIDTLTRVAVLSDTHLRTVTVDFEELWLRFFMDADIVLHAGDVTCEEVVRFMQQKIFYGVHGNMDSPRVRGMLSSHEVITIEGVRVGLTHGRGGPEGLEERILKDFDQVDMIVYGHSHIPVDHVRYGVRFFNPGTATGPARSGENTVGLLEFSDNGVTGRIIPV